MWNENLELKTTEQWNSEQGAIVNIDNDVPKFELQKPFWAKWGFLLKCLIGALIATVALVGIYYGVHLIQQIWRNWDAITKPGMKNDPGYIPLVPHPGQKSKNQSKLWTGFKFLPMGFNRLS